MKVLSALVLTIGALLVTSAPATAATCVQTGLPPDTITICTP